MWEAFILETPVSQDIPVSADSNAGSIQVDLYWTSTWRSLELMELSKYKQMWFSPPGVKG
jgi:hypothetical protein